MKLTFTKPLVLILLNLFIYNVSISQEIQHDAEHYLLLQQHKEQWSNEDEEIDERLAKLREENDGRPPNIVYILVDDVGFGELGSPELNLIRGYKTPNINKLAKEGISFTRMYTESSCTPTRAAFLTGRLPIRSHMFHTKIVPPEGSGLNREEVTIAEVLSQAGYNTAHIGKWHQGDIEEAGPHLQGFDIANYPIHNQATFGLMVPDSETENWANNVDPKRTNNPDYRLDKNFRPRGWVLGVEARKGEKAREWGTKAGDPSNYTFEYYNKLNDRYKRQVIEQLQRMANEDNPFFLNYWPQIPIDFGRVNKVFSTANGGTMVEAMAELDANIGDIMKELDRLGIAENTIVMVMGDNGPMLQAIPESGFSEMIFRGGKGKTTEGGIRVNAFIRWPKGIEAGSVVGDMIHVSDLYTTFARIANGIQYLPTDRIIDGVDQVPLLLLGDGKGRRDYLHVYNGPVYAATIKEQYKVHWGAPGSTVFEFKIFDLYRDPRELRPLRTEGMWAANYFPEMRQRHQAFIKKFPNRPETTDVPYGGMEELRPETEAMLKAYHDARKLLEQD